MHVAFFPQGRNCPLVPQAWQTVTVAPGSQPPFALFPQDTRYQCFEGPMRWLMGMGIAWAVLFCLGFPLGVALALWRNKSRLDDTAVRAHARGAGACKLRAGAL